MQCLLVLRRAWDGVQGEYWRRRERAQPIQRATTDADPEALARAVTPSTGGAEDREEAKNETLLYVAQALAHDAPRPDAATWAGLAPMARYRTFDPEWVAVAPRFLAEDFAAETPLVRDVAVGYAPERGTRAVQSATRGGRRRRLSVLRRDDYSHPLDPLDFATLSAQAERVLARHGDDLWQAYLAKLAGDTEQECADRLGISLSTWQRRAREIRQDLNTT